MKSHSLVLMGGLIFASDNSIFSMVGGQKNSFAGVEDKLVAMENRLTHALCLTSQLLGTAKEKAVSYPHCWILDALILQINALFRELYGLDKTGWSKEWIAMFQEICGAFTLEDELITQLHGKVV